MALRKIFICFLLFNFQNLTAQSLKWFEGSLVLSNCKVLVGKIALEPQHDLILFDDGISRDVYPAFRLKSFYFYDREADVNRRYISMQQKNNVRTAYQLYEVVVTGQVEVLRRQKENSVLVGSTELNFNYYIKYNESITPLKKFGRKVFPKMLAATDERLDKYVTDRRLKTYDMGNAIQIIEYYNRLVKSAESLARY
jgi:hypothetical protein